jgi:hypothetical protein
MNTKPSMLVPSVRRNLWWLLLTITLAPLICRAQTQYMSYQGYLTDGSGTALGSTNTGPKAYDVVFRIWDLPTGGTVGGSDDLFAELQTVTVDNGYFSVLLGQGTSYQTEPHGQLASVFTSLTTPRYVEMTVLGIGVNGASVTILPRLQLVAAPYSLLAVNAINVTGTNIITPANLGTNIGLWQVSGPNLFYNNGNVGIGTSTPGFPLNFPNTLGDKISLWGQSGNNFGLGIEPALLQIHADVAGSSIAFGYGSSTNFTEHMRIQGGGNVGIGTTLPGATLEVNGTAQVDGTTTLGGFANLNGGVYLNNANGFHQSSQGQFTIDAQNFPGGRFSVGDDGYVGIGISQADAPLHVVTGNFPAEIVSSSSSVGTWLDLENTSGGTIDWNIIVAGTGNGDIPGTLLFNTGPQPNETTNLAMAITPNGYVGVGTTTPSVPLEVAGDYYHNIGGGFWYVFANNNNDADGISGPAIAASGAHNNPISIYADYGVQAGGGFFVTSDRRIKKDLVKSESANDLKTLNRLQVTDYNYKDVVNYGHKHRKGLIAQEVESVFPDAVSKKTGVVPDIYQMAAFQGGWVVVTNDLKKGDRVRLITEKGESIHEVLEAAPDRFRTEFKPEGDKVFVFGREVHDYRSLDYDAISVLNVSATQELAKRMDELEQKAARVDALEQQVAELKKMVAQLAQDGKGPHVAALPAPQNAATADARTPLISVNLGQ